MGHIDASTKKHNPANCLAKPFANAAEEYAKCQLECVECHDQRSNCSWKVNTGISNPKSGVIIRTLKSNDVMKATPIEAVAQMSRRALLERSKSMENIDDKDREKQLEEDEVAGFQRDLLIDIDPQRSAAADSDAMSIGSVNINDV